MDLVVHDQLCFLILFVDLRLYHTSTVVVVLLLRRRVSRGRGRGRGPADLGSGVWV